MHKSLAEKENVKHFFLIIWRGWRRKIPSPIFWCYMTETRSAWVLCVNIDYSLSSGFVTYTMTFCMSFEWMISEEFKLLMLTNDLLVTGLPQLAMPTLSPWGWRLTWPWCCKWMLMALNGRLRCFYKPLVPELILNDMVVVFYWFSQLISDVEWWSWVA